MMIVAADVKMAIVYPGANKTQTQLKVWRL